MGSQEIGVQLLVIGREVSGVQGGGCYIPLWAFALRERKRGETFGLGTYLLLRLRSGGKTIQWCVTFLLENGHCNTTVQACCECG